MWHLKLLFDRARSVASIFTAISAICAPKLFIRRLINTKYFFIGKALEISSENISILSNVLSDTPEALDVRNVLPVVCTADVWMVCLQHPSVSLLPSFLHSFTQTPDTLKSLQID